MVNSQKNCCGWGWTVTLGVLFILLGIGATILPGMAGLAVAFIVGWALVAGAILYLFHSFGTNKGWSLVWSVCLAIVYGAAGFFVLANPMKGLVTLTLVLAVYLIASGIVRIVFALSLRGQRGRGWVFFGGIVSLVLGIMIYRQWPLSSLWFIGFLVGIDFIYSGWTMIMMAVCNRNRNSFSPVTPVATV